jgi:hypothetical protein
MNKLEDYPVFIAAAAVRITQDFMTGIAEGFNTGKIYPKELEDIMALVVASIIYEEYEAQKVSELW